MAEGDVAAVGSSVESTADVAADVYESMEESSVDTASHSAETPAETAVTATPQETPTPAVVQPAPTEAEKLLHEAGYKDPKRDDGRHNRIPYDKVVKIIENGINQGKGQFGEKYKAVEAERAQYRADLDEMYADLRGEPKAFLEKLAQHDPRYQAFLQPAAAPAPAVPQTEMPSPDITLQDGSKTYSIDGLKKLLEWNTSNVEATLMPKLDERLKPWQDREQAAKAREEGEKATNAVREKTRTLIAEAQGWPGFKEHEADILKALQEDSATAKAENRRPTLSLDAAYRQAVLPKMAADRNKMREELLKEINTSAAKTPTTTHGGAETVKKPGPADTRSIAARIIDQAGG